MGLKVADKMQERDANEFYAGGKKIRAVTLRVL